MIVVGKIDWYGDKKARREGRNGDYGYISSLDKEIKGSFKLYKEQLNYNGSKDEFRDEFVTFSPNTIGRIPKARNVYFLGEHPDKNELKEALLEYETNSQVYSILIELVKKSDEPVESQVSVLLSFFYRRYLDAALYLPFIKKNDQFLLTSCDAFGLLPYLSSNDEIRDMLVPVVRSNSEYYIDNFSKLSYAEKKRFVCLMSDDFLVETHNIKNSVQRSKFRLSRNILRTNSASVN